MDLFLLRMQLRLSHQLLHKINRIISWLLQLLTIMELHTNKAISLQTIIVIWTLINNLLNSSKLSAILLIKIKKLLQRLKKIKIYLKMKSMYFTWNKSRLRKQKGLLLARSITSSPSWERELYSPMLLSLISGIAQDNLNYPLTCNVLSFIAFAAIIITV